MSGITVGTALAISAGVGAAGSIASGVIGSKAAGNAAKTQAQASVYAADLQKQASDESLQFQKDQFATQQKNIAPWLQAGTGAINTLSGLMNSGYFKDWTGQFQAPTAATEQNDPGYQFRLAEGQKAIERSAASRGLLGSGGTAKALQQYGQDYASNEYGNVYNRALQQYQQKFNEFQTNQANTYNRYAGLAGVGQQAATTLGQLGQSAAGNVTNILNTSAQNIGNAYQNAAAARASGYVGSANAWSGALNGLGNNFSQYVLLSQLMKQQPYGGGYSI